MGEYRGKRLLSGFGEVGGFGSALLALAASLHGPGYFRGIGRGDLYRIAAPDAAHQLFLSQRLNRFRRERPWRAWHGCKVRGNKRRAPMVRLMKPLPPFTETAGDDGYVHRTYHIPGADRSVRMRRQLAAAMAQA